MLTLFVIWAVMATIVLGLALTRKFAAREEDDYIHVNDTRATARQSAVANTLEMIDKWGKLLTIIVVVYGLGLLGAYMYISWQQASQLSPQ